MTDTDVSVDEVASQLESRLMSQGLYVTELTFADGTYHLEYESVAAEQGTIPHRELGRVINLFREVHPDDWTGANIEAVVTDFEGEPKGTWQVAEEWLAALETGDLSEIEFSERVVETLSR